MAYLTLAGSASGEIVVSRSRFLCVVERVEDEISARGVVEEARRNHWDARHHCSAFVIGPDRALERATDDGEPPGTGGAPMLEVLRGRGLSDVVAVVTRWFGGTLLGAGGLVRAYGDAVRAGLEVTGTRRRRLLTELALELGHADAGRLESELRTRGVAVLDTTYAEGVTLLLGAAPDAVGGLHALVAELTGGTAVARPVGDRWVDARQPGH
jgi:uncharacterized YigZ family protein